MATLERLHGEVRREDVVSWIGEFSYIFSTDTFDLNDSHLGNKIRSSLRQSAEVEIVVLKNASQFPTTIPQAIEKPHTPPIPCRPAPVEVEVSTKSSASEKQLLESDDEARGQPTPNSQCSICGTRYPGSSTRRQKRKWKRIKLFGDRVKKKMISGCPHCDHLAQDIYKSEENGQSDIYEVVQPPETISRQAQRSPSRQEQLSQPKHSRPSKGARQLETPDLSPKDVLPDQKPKGKTWFSRRRDDTASNYNEKESKSPRSRPPYSWFSDTKRYLNLLSSRGSNKLASIRRPWGVRLSEEHGKEISSETSLHVTVDDASSYSTAPSSPRHVSAGTSTGSTTLTAGSKTPSCNTSHTGNFDQHLRLNINSVPLRAPQPYQCTFCLVQCIDKEDWLHHERCYHFQKWWTNYHDQRGAEGEKNNSSEFSEENASTRVTPRPESYHSMSQKGWANSEDTLVVGNENNNDFQPSQWSASTRVAPDLESFQSSSQSNQEEQAKDWFWNCGFCDAVLRCWDERQEHIVSEHFVKGTTMSLWDPLKPPYPWDRNTGIPISGFPAWNLQELLAIQQRNLVDSIDRVGEDETQKKPKKCRVCDMPTKNDETHKKHMDLWHWPRNNWSCPSSTSLRMFFQTNEDDEGTLYDKCLCCHTTFDVAQQGPNTLTQHLQDTHNFYESSCQPAFFNKEQFNLHLASCHGFHVERIKPFMKSCETNGSAPAMMIDS